MDQGARSTERAASQGDPQAEAAALTARVRAGTLAPERLKLAADCGHPAARIALGVGCTKPRNQSVHGTPPIVPTVLHYLGGYYLLRDDGVLQHRQGDEPWVTEVKPVACDDVPPPMRCPFCRSAEDLDTFQREILGGATTASDSLTCAVLLGVSSILTPLHEPRVRQLCPTCLGDGGAWNEDAGEYAHAPTWPCPTCNGAGSHPEKRLSVLHEVGLALYRDPTPENAELLQAAALSLSIGHPHPEADGPPLPTPPLGPGMNDAAAIPGDFLGWSYMADVLRFTLRPNELRQAAQGRGLRSDPASLLHLRNIVVYQALDAWGNLAYIGQRPVLLAARYTCAAWALSDGERPPLPFRLPDLRAPEPDGWSGPSGLPGWRDHLHGRG